MHALVTILAYIHSNNTHTCTCIHTHHNTTQPAGAVAVKLDRSELSHIEALARRLQTYEDFKHHAQDTLLALQKSLQEAHQLLNDHTTTITTVNESAQQVCYRYLLLRSTN